MDFKNDANIRIFWVINKGAMFGIRMELAVVLGDLQVTPWQQSPVAWELHFQFMPWFHYTSTKLDWLEKKTFISIYENKYYQDKTNQNKGLVPILKYKQIWL